ncbi:hypothetical protein [Dinoroseobacter sp. S124A]|uniref:hypothetical protein n=1 Tax=Dinoroseobacter sp. S124A TaxID=3415128 RepID=UPI003C7D2719
MEFSFEDLTISELGRFEYRYLVTTSIDRVEMSILECILAYRSSGHSRMLRHVDTKT